LDGESVCQARDGPDEFTSDQGGNAVEKEFVREI
jgi:hypothetical protein